MPSEQRPYCKAVETLIDIPNAAFQTKPPQLLLLDNPPIFPPVLNQRNISSNATCNICVSARSPARTFSTIIYRRLHSAATPMSVNDHLTEHFVETLLPLIESAKRSPNLNEVDEFKRRITSDLSATLDEIHAPPSRSSSSEGATQAPEPPKLKLPSKEYVERTTACPNTSGPLSSTFKCHTAHHHSAVRLCLAVA